ncbi:MAG: protein kinase [Alphaproteobacteria bacterium]|nr:protein kinase [Alphaproteobacteria bacterium]
MDSQEMLAQRICADHGYEFVRACNAGASKKTFHVRHAGQDLALKLFTSTPDHERLSREITALSACNHANISKILDHQSRDIDGTVVNYLVEEYIGGGTLNERLTKGRLARPDTHALALAMSEAIAHLASRNLVHRDIKPDNIMYRDDGAAVLVDLGVARHLNATTITQPFILAGPCTPQFAAPEQLLNEKSRIDWRTDQFGLGVTLSVATLAMHPYSGDMDLNNGYMRLMAQRPPAIEFIDAANSQGLGILIPMVEFWPIKRFVRPADLIVAWQNLGA